MDVNYNMFDKLKSIYELNSSSKADGDIVLNGRIHEQGFKMMLVQTALGERVLLRDIIEKIKNTISELDFYAIEDQWIVLDDDKNIKCCFVSMFSSRGVVLKRALCRYTAFSYIVKNTKLEIYETAGSDNENGFVGCQAYIDVRMPISYTVRRETITSKTSSHKICKFLKSKDIISEFYFVQINCQNKDIYEDGYVEYRCGDYLIPITRQIIEQGYFYLNYSSNEPVLLTRHQNRIDLSRKELKNV